jgi:hypothetical protein
MAKYHTIPEQPAPYTVDEDEPETIEAEDPRDFNAKTHINREDLVDFFLAHGVSRKQAEKKAELEFEARAPNYGLWGANVPGPSDWDIGGKRHRTEAGRAKAEGWARATRMANSGNDRSQAYTRSEKRKDYGTRYCPDEHEPRHRSTSRDYSSPTPHRSNTCNDGPRVRTVNREPHFSNPRRSHSNTAREEPTVLEDSHLHYSATDKTQYVYATSEEFIEVTVRDDLDFVSTSQTRSKFRNDARHPERKTFFRDVGSPTNRNNTHCTHTHTQYETSLPYHPSASRKPPIKITPQKGWIPSGHGRDRYKQPSDINYVTVEYGSEEDY